jgi:hypothetical protein
MKQSFFFLAFFLVSNELLFSQTLTFTRYYGGQHYDDARGAAPAADGEFLFTGLSKSGVDTSGDMYLTKINAAGAVLWTRYYGRKLEDGGNAILPTADGGYLITGHTAFTDGKDCDGYLVKTDANGTKEWDLLVGTPEDDVTSQAIQMADGSYVVTGRSEDPSTGFYHPLLVRIDARGKLISQAVVPTSEPMVAYSVAPAADGNLFLTGYTYNPYHAGPDQLVVLKCDLSGTLIWLSIHATDEDARGHTVVPTPDGGCLVVGGVGDVTQPYEKMFVDRVERDGQQSAWSWVMPDQGAGDLNAAVLTPQGNLAVAGVYRPANALVAKPFFAELDANLNLLNWRVVDGPAECHTRCLTQNAAGDFLLGGYVQSDKLADIYLAKIAGIGHTVAAKNVQEQPFLMFPNPFHDLLYLKVGLTDQPKELVLLDESGKKAVETSFTSDEYLLRNDGLKSGIYFLTVKDSKGQLLASGKVQVH